MFCCGSIAGLRSLAAATGVRWLALAWHRPTLASLLVFFSSTFAFCQTAPVRHDPHAKNVLVLYGWTDRNSFKELEPFKSSLRAHLSVPVNFNVEYLESVRFEDPAYRTSVSESLYQAYKSSNLDLVVVGGYPALRFALDYRDRIFPGVPIVFVEVATNRMQGQKIWPGVTGSTTNVDIRGTLDLALHLSPDTQNVVLLSGTSEFERYWEVLFRKELRRHANLKLAEFVGLPDKSMLTQVSAMPAHTIVFVQIAWQDAAEPALTVDDILAKVSQLFPTYSIFVDGMDHGFVGGSFADENAGGKRGGEIAARVLSGEKPEQIPVEPAAGVLTVVDWRQLHHWNISEGLLPPGAIVLNQPPSMWELYKWRMIAIGLLVLTQTALIVGLLIHRRRRKRAEETLNRQLRFESLISEISSEFINLPSTQIESGIQKSLVRLREFLEVDRVSIFEFADKHTNLRLRHTAMGRATVSVRKVLSREDFPWFFGQLESTKHLIISSLDKIPEGAKEERALFRDSNAGAVAIYPLKVESRLVGILSFVMSQAVSSWSRDALPQLEVVSEVYANAFARELAKKALFESEVRFRAMGDAAPAFIWMSDQEGKFTYLNRRTLDFTGAQEEELSGDGWCAYVHPEDLPAALQANARALDEHERFTREYRVKRFDGVYRWMFDIGNPRFDAEGLFLGFIGSAVDVTDQKLAREALEKLSGQLISAQEKERSHIARELHDDICQRLAMLSLRIEKVTKSCGNGAAPIANQLEQVWQECSKLTGDVQALSHELHSSLLDNLGLVSALKSFCREFAEQNGAVVEITERDIPDSLPKEVSLSFFRVVQEALHNAAKYSGQKNFEVLLQGKSGELQLEVSDRGVGFDVAKVKNMEGLGLVSMRERIHLLNGTINIESKPNAGTRIYASVPLVPSSTAMPTSED